MSRTPKIAPEQVDSIIATERVEQAEQAVQQLRQVQATYSQGRDLINQMLGQSQALHAASDLLRTGAVSKHAQIKENKLYQQLAGMTAPHGAVLKGTWEEYCVLLGRSVDMVDRDIANLQAFGEQALEAMSLAGIGYRDLQQFRKLPVDQKTALIEAAKAGDKDTLLELAEDLIVKHAKEKEQLTAEVADLKGDIDAKDQLIGEKNEELDKLKGKKARHKPSAEDLLAHKARPLYELIASAGILAAKLSAAVGNVLNEQDDLLKAEAYNALTLATQYMLRAADENYMPLDMEALGLDTADFETKALGLGGLAAAEAA